MDVLLSYLVIGFLLGITFLTDSYAKDKELPRRSLIHNIILYMLALIVVMTIYPILFFFIFRRPGE